jgi:hypothetical protein
MDTRASKKTDTERHAKFLTLAENRTNMALEAIRRIGNLSNRQLYDFEEAEVKKILRVLRSAVSEIEARFASPKGSPAGKLKF